MDETPSRAQAKDPRRRFGDRGEDLAAAFFEAQGFRIAERNWSCRLGEIDLVVERGGRVHFVEVKTRRSSIYGHPEEAITPRKLDHLRKAIELFLREHPEIREYQADALAIDLEPGARRKFNYIENIL